MNTNTKPIDLAALLSDATAPEESTEAPGVVDAIVIDDTLTAGDLLREVALSEEIDQTVGSYIEPAAPGCGNPKACGLGALYLALTAHGHIEDEGMDLYF